MKCPHRQVARWFQSRLGCEVDGYALHAMLGEESASCAEVLDIHFVRHVSHANNIPGLGRIFERVWELREEDLDRFRADGARLKQAIVRTCLPLPDCLRNQPASEETTEKLARALLRSLETPGAVAAP